MGQPAIDPEDEPDIFDIPDDAADEASTLRGLADFQAGRVISHEAVKRCRVSWGPDTPLPRPHGGEYAGRTTLPRFWKVSASIRRGLLLLPRSAAHASGSLKRKA